MILADSSVWIDHFRSSLTELTNLLALDQIAIHPFVIAELALGSLHDRATTLQYLDLLPRVGVAQLYELRQMIEARTLYSKGIGLTDAHLLASCLLTPGTQLWTRDASLAGVAKALGILFDPANLLRQHP